MDAEGIELFGIEKPMFMLLCLIISLYASSYNRVKSNNITCVILNEGHEPYKLL